MVKLLLALCLLVTSTCLCQTKIYLGDQINSSKKIFEIKNGEVYRYSSGLFAEPILFVDGNKIYADRFRSKCLYTFDNNQIYFGDGSSSFDVVYELKEGKLLLKTGDIFEKCIYTIADSKVYAGDSKSPFDVLFTIEFDDKFPNHIFVIAALIGPI